MSPSNCENGQRFEKFVRYPKGDPENPLSWDEMAAKFRALAGTVLSPERCDEIIAAISTAQACDFTRALQLGNQLDQQAIRIAHENARRQDPISPAHRRA